MATCPVDISYNSILIIICSTRIFCRGMPNGVVFGNISFMKIAWYTLAVYEELYNNVRTRCGLSVMSCAGPVVAWTRHLCTRLEISRVQHTLTAGLLERRLLIKTHKRHLSPCVNWKTSHGKLDPIPHLLKYTYYGTWAHMLCSVDRKTISVRKTLRSSFTRIESSLDYV